MGSGDWFRSIITSKKARSKQLKRSSESETLNGASNKNHHQKKSSKFANGDSGGKLGGPGVQTEDIAATRIQSAYRAYMARKSFRRLKGIVRLQVQTQTHAARRQALTALNYLNLWNRIHYEIRARRLSMVTEGRMRQKKLENQLKLDAKLHDLEVEWCGGPDTMEETLARIHQREEAAVRRERALAYAFSHQWRASTNSILGPPEIGKANWGWSWKERWIAARPWESRALIPVSPKKSQNGPTGKPGKNMTTPNAKGPVSVKNVPSSGKGSFKARRLSYPGMDKANPQGTIKTEEEMK